MEATERSFKDLVTESEAVRRRKKKNGETKPTEENICHRREKYIG